MKKSLCLISFCFGAIISVGAYAAGGDWVWYNLDANNKLIVRPETARRGNRKIPNGNCLEMMCEHGCVENNAYEGWCCPNAGNTGDSCTVTEGIDADACCQLGVCNEGKCGCEKGYVANPEGTGCIKLTCSAYNGTGIANSTTYTGDIAGKANDGETDCKCPTSKPFWNGTKCGCPAHSSTTVTTQQIGTTACYCKAGYVANGTGCTALTCSAYSGTGIANSTTYTGDIAGKANDGVTDCKCPTITLYWNVKKKKCFGCPEEEIPYDYNNEKCCNPDNIYKDGNVKKCCSGTVSKGHCCPSGKVWNGTSCSDPVCLIVTEKSECDKNATATTDATKCCGKDASGKQLSCVGPYTGVDKNKGHCCLGGAFYIKNGKGKCCPGKVVGGNCIVNLGCSSICSNCKKMNGACWATKGNYSTYIPAGATVTVTATGRHTHGKGCHRTCDESSITVRFNDVKKTYGKSNKWSFSEFTKDGSYLTITLNDGTKHHDGALDICASYVISGDH